MREDRKWGVRRARFGDAATTLPPARAIFSSAAVAVLGFGMATLATAQSCRGAEAHVQRAAPAHRCELMTLDERSAGRHSGAIMLGTSLALAVYGRRQWWRDGFGNRFKAVNEGWFGADTYSGGADKLGHFYMTYASSRLLTRAFVRDGGSHARSVQVAALYTLAAFASVEVLDGFSRKWDFSREDMLMNAAGVGAAVLLERYPDIDRKFDLRILYRPSNEQGQGFDPFGDYSGQTYLAVAKLAGFHDFGHSNLLRYVEVTAGYGTRGFDAGSGRRGTRNVYVGLSLNLSELLNRTSTGAGPARRVADTMLEYVQIPGTVALWRHELDAHRGNRGQPEGAAPAAARR